MDEVQKVGLFQNSTYHCQKPYRTKYLLPVEMYPHLTFFTMENVEKRGKMLVDNNISKREVQYVLNLNTHLLM
jgi:hypothetical protein